MADVPFPGFAYDALRAQAMANAVRSTFAQAQRATDITLPDKLAALGIVAAELLLASHYRDRVAGPLEALAVFAAAVAADRIKSGG